jgi:hypothetical protein
MRRASRRAAGVTALLSGVAALTAAAPAVADGVTRSISSSGTARFFAGPTGTPGIQSPEFRAEEEPEGTVDPFEGRIVNRRQSRGRGRGGTDSGTPRAAANPGLVTSFDGLDHFDQRFANGGNQFSTEPPDQGLCVGNGHVVESANDVLKVYDQAGNAELGTVDLNTFYGYPAAINRGVTPNVFGQFVTDPSCLFDPATQRWFHVVLTLDTDPATGDFTGRNTLDLAVSASADPLGTWKIYHLPVQDDGTEGTPNHGCGGDDPTVEHPNACLGDYPHIGADANGFYITTNEYEFFGPEFHAAQVYAFSKQALAAGADRLTVTQLDTVGADRGRPGFTIWPATSPGRQFATGAGGTEYFLSSNAAEEVQGAAPTHSSRDLLVWSLANTGSLDSATPELTLDHTVEHVGRYGTPPTSDQKPGDFPLGQCVNDTVHDPGFGLGTGCWRLFFDPADEPAHDEVESRLDSNDTRMQQVVFADGRLWGALDTALTLAGQNKAGIEWFAVDPSITSRGSLGAQVVQQGYLGMDGNNVTYPAIGMRGDGQGVMAFTLVGADHFPSAAYAPIDAQGGAGNIHVIAEGLGPSDGFTGYKAFVGAPPRTRWGDYGAAVADGDSIWVASEYVGQTCTLDQYIADSSCGLKRSALANWGTRISRLRP